MAFMRSRVIPGLVAVAALVAGCGSSGAGKPSASPTTPQTSTTIARTVPDTPAQRAADRALARRVVLRLNDLPSGYKAEKDDSSGGPGDNVPPAELKKFAICAGVPPRDVKALFDQPTGGDFPSADSPTFDSGGAELTRQSFMGSVMLAPSPDVLRPLLAIIDRASQRGCWKPFIAAALNSGKPSEGTFSHLTVEPSGLRVDADQFSGINSRVIISEGFISLPATIDILFARRGRSGVALFGAGIGRDIDHNLERSLVQKMLDRLHAEGV